jgi:hypothetical protein
MCLRVLYALSLPLEHATVGEDIEVKQWSTLLNASTATITMNEPVTVVRMRHFTYKHRIAAWQFWKSVRLEIY